MQVNKVLAIISISVILIIFGMCFGNYITESIIAGLCDNSGVAKFDKHYYTCRQVETPNLDVVK